MQKITSTIASIEENAKVQWESIELGNRQILLDEDNEAEMRAIIDDLGGGPEAADRRPGREHRPVTSYGVRSPGGAAVPLRAASPNVRRSDHDAFSREPHPEKRDPVSAKWVHSSLAT